MRVGSRRRSRLDSFDQSYGSWRDRVGRKSMILYFVMVRMAVVSGMGIVKRLSLFNSMTTFAISVS